MARKDMRERRRRNARRYDGALRCVACADPFPQPDNDWCPVLEGITCEDCCRLLMMGDERLLGVVSQQRGEQVSHDDVVAECTECERLVRLVSEHLLDEETDAARLPMH